MELKEVLQSLSELFQKPLKDFEKRHVVFWIDKEAEFADVLDDIQLDNVKIHRWTANNNFFTKYLLEKEDIHNHYLIYTTEDVDDIDNWLMDTVLYSKTFFADKLSLTMKDLGMDSSLRGVVKQYKRFFDDKKRYSKLKSYAIEQYTEETFEIAMMSVLCNLRTPTLEEVLRTILMDTLDDSENKYLSQINKLLGKQVFWKYMNHYYGFDQEQPSLKKLFMHLTITALSHSIEARHLTNVKQYIGERGRTNALVFIDHWMHHRTDAERYDEFVKQIEKEIRLPEMIQHLSVDEFKKVDVFPYFDQAIILYIFNSLKQHHEDFETYKNLILLRRAKHFYGANRYVYEALYNTVEIVEFAKGFSRGVPKESMKDMYAKYVQHYYKMETYYRKFYVAFDQAEQTDLLKELRTMVEHYYTNWYMGELSTHWSCAIQEEVKDQWGIEGVLNQREFYKTYVAPKINKGERVFVIISDALRYDIGVEITNRLNSETMGSSEIHSVLSVIPSITKLGMAALLPHRNIEFNDKGQIIVDGMASQGIENRMEILRKASEDSIAISYMEFMAMNKPARRERFKGKKLIYIYHNSIDATGDHASTEMYTFDAVERSLDEIYNIVKAIRDDLSGTNILITADHGFIYQRNPLEESDKIEREDLSYLEVKRRYILSKEDRDIDGLLRIPLKGIISNGENLTAYVPKSTIRFKMKGQGVNFVHGGASLQEVIVPVISFKNARRGQAVAREIEQVDIKLTNTTRKITNSIFNLSFFQTEKVEEKMTPRTVVIHMADEQGRVISNEEIVIGDKTADKPEERIFKLQFVLKSFNYDRNKDYYLMIKDIETGVVLEKIPFRISLGIVNDFDF
ncbi:alkaline phosphatase domain-containing protein [Bacillus methanolicus PB1]|uniref:Alkaline phosphatase domain-containing protein n=1 Tax=Bacillus methanolicus PB1 TaxID=997296 RepID=I3E466_BACMT|nr:BREX-1 system phosphatase PglZ type A [Bacillus methanolicus]EIJ81287.1 alkaline phosphatase domain-containing protein [Bacillus methanolicus PB1]